MLSIVTCVLAFAIALLLGRLLIPMLRRVKAGQSIREDGPTWHISKQGTPTMGGLIFAIATLAAVLIAGWSDILYGRTAPIIISAFAVIYGMIGFIDDYVKVKKKRNLGLTAVQKLLLQVAVAIVLISLLRTKGHLSSHVYIPFINKIYEINWILYMVCGAFVIVGAVNAVNITDGVDGLCTGVSMPVALFFAVTAFYWGNTSLSLFASALFGALAGFLIYNFHPAKVFMGDTGSFFIGGAICGMAFAMDIPVILAVVGIVYVIETLSDIVQIVYFKATKGKRFFKMAPLHHHLEMSGWSEVKIFMVFSLASLVCCMLACYGVIGRYA